MAHHISNYRKIFIYLLIGTALTVGASYFDFNVSNSMAGAIFVGLIIASFKGYLVAANFMHLNSEKKNDLMDFNFNCDFTSPTLIHTRHVGS